jgi:hypothetical protein
VNTHYTNRVIEKGTTTINGDNLHVPETTILHYCEINHQIFEKILLLEHNIQNRITSKGQHPVASCELSMAIPNIPCLLATNLKGGNA